MRGLIFAIEEMAVHDGPGLRACIFLKGCPLRCQWCHNPEGWDAHPRRVKSPNGCLHCGRCHLPCESKCTGCGGCLSRCPRGLLRVSGKYWQPTDLARRVHRLDPILMDGGVTVSGGEPLMQAQFLTELLPLLSPLHRAMETSGFAPADDFRQVLDHLELVYFDLKVMDEEKHQYFTGVSNAPILNNLSILKHSGVPFIVRVPFISGVNDDEANLLATLRAVEDAPNLQRVELLPYNTMAGSKYPLVGISYPHTFTQPTPDTITSAQALFESHSIPCLVRSQAVAK